MAKPTGGIDPQDYVRAFKKLQSKSSIGRDYFDKPVRSDGTRIFGPRGGDKAFRKVSDIKNRHYTHHGHYGQSFFRSPYSLFGILATQGKLVRFRDFNRNETRRPT